MVLILQSIDCQKQWRDFRCQINTIEAAFDVLNLLVDRGNTLLQAQLLDGDTSVKLPVEAFDGESSATGTVHQLQDEWERLLSAPIAPTQFNRSELLHRLLDNHQANARYMRSMLGRMEKLLDRASAMPEGFQRNCLLNHYGQIISHMQASLAHVETKYATRNDT